MKYVILLLSIMLLLSACANEVDLNENDTDDGSNVKLEVKEPPKGDLCAEKYCQPERCCHPKKCVALDEPLDCSDTYCTLDYQEDDIVSTDCACINNTCTTVKND
ncbi:hypothetical protein KY334_00340 [Candidatus Woesearchaeota archaeon]|nr:hypothetical protein [Candidatus Woesearchaeota archaeon]